MRQVALAVGVAVSTVSKALRNDASIPPARCRQIQAAARRLGYRPHPLVSALMAQLHHRRRRADPHQLAWIDFWPRVAAGPAVMSAEPVLRGGRQRAQELGYGIEVYHADREGLTPDRLCRMLTTRGQWGIIFPPVPAGAARLEFDLRGLAAVTIGTSLHYPVMHRVSPNHFQGCTLAFEQLRGRGMRRIGLALSPEMNQRVEGKWLGAFLAAQQQLPVEDRLAPLVAPAEDREVARAWIRRERPQAILQAEVFPWLGRPRVASLLPLPGVRCIGNLDHRPDQLGRVAVEMVVAQIHRNERGSPAIPQTVQIDGVWQPGPT
jgi:LacI family transcriptional regulator